MKEHPILFSGEMVRAILDGSKVQTRRAMRVQPSEGWSVDSYGEVHRMVDDCPDPDQVLGWGPSNYDGSEAYACPYGKPGDRLWVRETFCNLALAGYPPTYSYRASDPSPLPQEGWSLPPGVKWKPSIFMPRQASRITLEVVSIRVERAHAITDADVRAEGVPSAAVDMWRKWLHPNDCHGHAFGVLWDSINGKGEWAKNPWVWRIEFKRVEGGSKA